MTLATLFLGQFVSVWPDIFGIAESAPPLWLSEWFAPIIGYTGHFSILHFPDAHIPINAPVSVIAIHSTTMTSPHACRRVTPSLKFRKCDSISAMRALPWRTSPLCGHRRGMRNCERTELATHLRSR